MNPSERGISAEQPAIGGYLLRRVLGRGGMGTVHLATSPTGALAAVKVINPELARDPDFRRRFRREVDAARRVARFCTAPVLDAGVEGDVAYLVTEYVKGPDLARAVRERGPMTGSDLEALAVGVAVALNAIHGAGVIHRDLKPSNVLLSPMGPRVIDFGIAKLVDGENLTSQVILGTPAFMAPEQVRGEELTPAADVYAWGGVIVFAGTGRLPFGGGAPAEVLYRIVNEGPRLDGLDERMRGVVERAMAKDPARRPSARELLAELVGGPELTPDTATRVVERTWTGGVMETGPGPRYGTAPASAPGPAPASGPAPGPGAALDRGFASEPSRGHAPGAVAGPPSASGTADARAPRPAPATSGWGGPPASPAPPGTAGTAPDTAGRDEPRAAGRGRRIRPTARLAAAAVAVTVVAGGAVWWATTRPGGQWSFQAGFGDARRPWSEGTTDAGSARVTDGAYLLSVNPGWRLWKSAPVPDEPETGTVVTGSARLTDGTGEFGVWCRGGAGGGDRYEFAVGSAGTVSITKRRAGRPPAVLYGPVKNAEVRASADNRVVAECRPDGRRIALRMWVNEGFAGEAVDSDPYGPGQTGVYAAPYGDAVVRVRFASFGARPAGD
ncbi:serine/threonine-protein kinase [Streptosporangium sp. NPDC004379]|uniref:serine/threonine-protein kinase n=1 Tax=Streptosporangium sp. NPDC004379 TaxID=3366189 RepID=UPI003683F588